MKIKSLFVYPLVVVLPMAAKAQVSQSQIINASSKYTQVDGYQFDYSIGEMTLVQTFTLPEGLLTQGFLQPLLSSISDPDGGGSWDIKVWPDVSPNGDGQGHESLYIEGIELYPDNDLEIFNRWGNLIYQTKSYDNTERIFTGKANTGLLIDGAEVPDGTYFYILKVRDAVKGKLVLNGFFVIKRK